MTIDEYQNFIAGSSESFAKILTQARKYKLCLLLAQQFISQGSDTEFVNTIKSGTVVKISGYSSDSEKNAQLVHRTSEELSKLPVGRFFFKVAEHAPIKVQTSGHLVIPSPDTSNVGKVDIHDLNAHYMTDTEWSNVLQKQLCTYYSRKHDEHIERESANEKSFDSGESKSVPEEPTVSDDCATLRL